MVLKAQAIPASGVVQRPMQVDFGEEGPTCPIVTTAYRRVLEDYIGNRSLSPLFFHGDALTVLRSLPDGSVDCALTSPPYWGKREYENGGIGLEKNYQEYIKNLAAIFLELKRALKPEGSFWLNLGDSYADTLARVLEYCEKPTAGLSEICTGWQKAQRKLDAAPAAKRLPEQTRAGLGSHQGARCIRKKRGYTEHPA